MSVPRLVTFTAADLPAAHALNELAVPAVNSVSETFLARLINESECSLTAHLGGALAGFLVLFGPGAAYASPNYCWFRGRYRDFVYVDRVVVAPGARRRGVARAFYRAAWRRASARGAPLACEVNLVPPNPASMDFHRALGFREVGRQATEGNAKTVCLMLRDAP